MVYCCLLTPSATVSLISFFQLTKIIQNISYITIFISNKLSIYNTFVTTAPHPVVKDGAMKLEEENITKQILKFAKI